MCDYVIVRKTMFLCNNLTLFCCSDCCLRCRISLWLEEMMLLLLLPSKDDFPLPHIDVLVDSTAKCKVFSFMDGFSGYNQIKMAPEDRDKTFFITPWGAFCYLVMLFGLINAGATY